MTSIYVTVHVKSWIGLRSLIKQPRAKKAYQEFSGLAYVTMDPGVGNAAGLSKYLETLMFKQYSPFHLPTPPYSILPDKFIDRRPRDIVEDNYTVYGWPGQPTEWTPELYKAARDKSVRQYTQWFPVVDIDDTDTTIHGLTIEHLPQVLAISTMICDYWHLCTPSGCLPHSPQEKFAAFLNAFGWRLLDHPLIGEEPVEQSPPPRKSFQDILVEKMESRAESLTSNTPNYSPAELRTKRRRVVKCSTSKQAMRKLNDISPPEMLMYRCNQPSVYVLKIGSVQYPICQDCEYDRTINLPADSYELLPIEAYEPPSHSGPRSHAENQELISKKKKKIVIKRKDRN